MGKDKCALEIKQRKRFKFGRNWLSYSKKIDESNIQEAVKALKEILNVSNLVGKSFLDVGCGSGTASLAARRLGAKVFSFDFDSDAVLCTNKLKKLHYPNDDDWVIQSGSVLDLNFLKFIGKFDIVYSWGVLHHTGDMWKALENIIIPLKNKKSSLILALYNDQGAQSNFWKKIKKLYNISPFNAFLIKLFFLPLYFILYLFTGILIYKNPFYYFANYKKTRGMSLYHDWIDWLGGYPFEVAKPDQINFFYRKKGFYLENIISTNSLGCNQYVFSRESS